MKTQLTYGLLTFSVFVVTSCETDKFQEQLHYDLPPFHTIEVNSSFDIFLSEDTVFSVDLLGDSRVLEDFQYTCADSILKVSVNSNSKWLTPNRNKIELHVKSKPLKLVEVKYTCNIQTSTPITSTEFGLIMKGKANEASLDLNCSTFYFWNNYPTGGKLELSGNTDALKLWNCSLMTVDAKNLNTNYALVDNDAKTDCMVTVTEKIDYHIDGGGNIHLYGSPAEINNLGTTSTGSLIQH